MQRTILTVNLLAPAGLAIAMLAAPPLACVETCPHGVDRTDSGGCNGGRHTCLDSATDSGSDTEAETTMGTMGSTTEGTVTATVTSVTEGTTTEATEGTMTVGTTTEDSTSTTGPQPGCGDEVVDEELGEECDNGAGNGDDQACTSECMNNVCGDGKVHDGVEACDDGAGNGDDQACLSSCEVADCGDGHAWEGVEACDDGNLEDGDGCSMACEVEHRVVFVTNENSLYKGNLGGVSEADEECNALAQLAALDGTYMAWLSDGDVGPSVRFGISPEFAGRFELVDGTVVANSWSELTSGTLLAEINKDESGNLSLSTVWTNTNADGTPHGKDHCNAWTDDTSNFSGHIGDSSKKTDDWTNFGDMKSSCLSKHALYCIQVQ